MKSAIRLFALLVAVVGLAFAAFAPAATQAQPRHASMVVGNPATLAVPTPDPCDMGGCAAASTSNR